MKEMRIILALVLFAALAIAVFPRYTVQATDILIWTGSVSSDGTPVTTPTLSMGVNYRIVVKPGVMYLGGPYYAYADAQYYANNPPDGWVWPSGTQPDSHSFLQINNGDVNWGPFSNGQPGYPPYNGHTYELLYNGQGAPITFRIYDWIDENYDDNSCHLNIEIYCEGAPGFTPGFWKHNIQVLLGLSRGSFSSFFEDGPHLTATELQEYLEAAGYTPESALCALTAKGKGSNSIRANCANALNAAAGFGPFED